MHGKDAQMVRPTHERAMLGSLATTRSPGVGMVWAPSLSPPRATVGASLGATSPLLAQEVLDLVHQLLRVEVVVTRWARRLVRRRVIILL